jgi:arginyl-tRNA synthetase
MSVYNQKTIIELIEKKIKKVLSNYPEFLGETNININDAKILIERSHNPNFGDYSTGFLLSIDTNPHKIEQYANTIIKKFSTNTGLFSVVTFTKPGFINFFINIKYL